jgi:RNA polymerase sigma factor (sigma-70 family)
MEVSALRYSGGVGLHARSPLLRLQSDERLVALIRRGSTVAFEVLVSRYHARLLAFCRHLLGSREDAEDVLQEVFSAAFNAMLDDDRPINVRPWLYRIARNRSLNHLRRIQAVGVDSMDIHLLDHGATTADKVHEREDFRQLVGDIQGLPETQRTALVLREMDALSYEQIAEAMETTVPSVKSLLVRARVSLAEAAEARMLTCEHVRIELGEVAEGLQRRPGPLVRRHLRTCERCSIFKGQLSQTNKALTAVLPIGGFALLRKLAILHIGHSAGAGSGASGAGAAGQAAAVGSTAAAGATAVMSSTTGGLLSASVGAIATKAAAGLAAAALVTAGAVEVEQPRTHPHHHVVTSHVAAVPAPKPALTAPAPPPPVHIVVHRHPAASPPHKPAKASAAASTAHKAVAKPDPKPTVTAAGSDATKTNAPPAPPPGRTQTQTDATVLAGSTTSTIGAAGMAGCTSDTTSSATSPTTTTSPPATTTTTPASSDPGSAQTTTTTGDQTNTTTGDQTTTTTGDQTTTSPDQTTTAQTTTTAPSPDTGTTTSTSSSTNPAPTGDSGCTSDSAGAASSGQPAPPSGGVAP